MFVNKERGQVLLTVVLVMIVALTVGLSLASRSIVDVRTSTEDADSQRALAAAEAGIEQALEELSSIPQTEFLDIGSAYQVDVTPASGNTLLLNNGNLTEKGDGIEIWFVEHIDLNGDGEVEPDYSSGWDGDKTLELFWGTSATACENAALEIIVIQGLVSSPILKRYAVDPCASRRGSNNFSDPDTGVYSIGGETLHQKLTVGGGGGVAPGSTVLYARVIPIYTNAIMAVEAGDPLPTQGYSINSTGEFQTADSKVKRSISVFKQYGLLPVEYLNYGLFSPCQDVNNDPNC